MCFEQGLSEIRVKTGPLIGAACGAGRSWQDTKCMLGADLKGSLLSVEEDLGCWRTRINLVLLLGRRMRGLDFLVT